MRAFLMILTLVQSLEMVDESTIGLPFLAGIVVLTSLCITWYRGVDPLVSPRSPFYSEPALMNHISSFVPSPQ